MSTQAFSETLRFITNVKLSELSKKNEKFCEHAFQVSTKADEHIDIDPIARLEVLVDGLRAWPGAGTDDFNLNDIERYLEQARRDPGFPPSVIDEWNRQAQAQFDNEGTRFDFACLFGMLVNDWLESKTSSSRSRTPGTDTAPSESFEKIGRKETIEQKEKLESLIFEEKKIDVEALEAYLNELFSSKDAQKELEQMRGLVGSFAYSLTGREITIGELKQVIESVLRTDALSEEKQATLKEFLTNPTITKELASVLNMQLSTMKSWSWPEEGVGLEPRRHLNGRTRFHLDAEILTCLLLHYLGVLWSVEFKRCLTLFLNSSAWKQFPKKLTRIEHIRRDIFFGSEEGCIDNLRHQFDKQHFFMCQLPSEFESVVDHYDESRGHRGKTVGSTLGTDLRFDTPVDLKQSLLHILSADIVVNKALHGQCTVLRTDLEWFGPSLPFDTITTILRFFGMPDREVNFMHALLSCPIVFKDDPTRQVRVRKRGVPLSYMFSTLFGELVMFVMDFAVNQTSGGLFLHRIHDDFWLWDADETRCVAAWTEMQRYASLAGLSFNKEKTGSVAIGKEVVHKDLPQGDVRWGFLLMDASGGRFKVDQAMVDIHIAELRRQLASMTSIFGWIRAYNKYMAFIVRNCGEPAIIYGKDHVDDIIDTLVRIQESLFSASSSDGLEHGTFATAIAKMIGDKFDVSLDDVPYGWYLWPNAAGGLEVKDALVDLFLLRAGYAFRSVDGIIRATFAAEEAKYSDAKKRWEKGDSIERTRRLTKHSLKGKSGIVSVSDPFFSFEEFTKSREERGLWWSSAYKNLLERPNHSSVSFTPRLLASLKLLGHGIDAFGGAVSWGSLSSYWQWIIALHHDQMVKKFGSLAVVDPATVPVGMVSVFKGSRMKWEQ